MLAYELEESGLAHLLKSFFKNSVEISFISGSNCSLENIFYTLSKSSLSSGVWSDYYSNSIHSFVPPTCDCEHLSGIFFF